MLQYTRAHLFFGGGLSFSRPVNRKGLSSSKEPQFVLEYAIHASESSWGGANDKPAHVFEVRMCKWMDDIPVAVPIKVTAYGLTGHPGTVLLFGREICPISELRGKHS
jgi:hypothetical protein